MRATWALWILLSASVAQADRIVVMIDPVDASALSVALAGRGAELLPLPHPEGTLRLDRAAIAQRTTVSANAQAGVWIEREAGGAEVCVVSADGRMFRHAPMPIDDSTPRVFAAIAASLLDEVLSPEGPNVNVDVYVTVDGERVPVREGPRVAAVEQPATIAPPSAVPVVAASAASESDTIYRADRRLLEVGAMLTPASVGIEAMVTFPIREQWRIGVMGTIHATADTVDPGPLVGGGVELRHVGRGQKHWDFGPIGGVATVNGVNLTFGGFGFARTWERAGSAISLSLTPGFVHESGKTALPGAWITLRWLFPI
jgi:hypothetical protein